MVAEKSQKRYGNFQGILDNYPEPQFGFADAMRRSLKTYFGLTKLI
jgi:hypothetical protein